MIDITHKSDTFREATAQAIVKVSLPETITSIKNNQVPKGNIFEMGKAAGLFAVKKTPDMIPDCHPLPIESTEINYEIDQLEIKILVTVKTIYKTGVEVEAMHGASVIALTMYDMLKPIDKGVEIHSIKLLQKKGGKSSFKNRFSTELKAAVIVCSDTISKGKKEDTAGKIIMEKLQTYGVAVPHYEIIPDEIKDIQDKTKQYVKSGLNLILFCGGTGLSPRDVSPEAIKPLLNREIPGIMEAARVYGQQRMPYAFLSRGIAGMIEKTLVLTLPGSTGGATETMDALFPHVLHLFKVAGGGRHD